MPLHVLLMYIAGVRFEWDAVKAKQNNRKHKVSFEEAVTVFFDPLTKVAMDPDHSDSENRWFAVGYSSKTRLLLVVHCLRDNDEVVRLISARKLTSSETRQFEEGL
jgi:uncharacterized protein